MNYLLLSAHWGVLGEELGSESKLSGFFSLLPFRKTFQLIVSNKIDFLLCLVAWNQGKL